VAGVGTDFAALGRLLANNARSAMLDLLMDGRAITAGELARVAGISPQTASGHLAELLGGGLVEVAVQGRHRYFRLVSAEVAQALEVLSQICPATPVRSLRQSRDSRVLSAARTCYDHLAGSLGVAVLDAMTQRRWLTATGDDFSVTAQGERSLRDIGVEVADAQRLRRSFARSCLDWTERRPHLAGSLGAAVADTFISQRWVERVTNSRGLKITPGGRSALANTFGISWP
jgi:DNA-binding transcriptional ArsR family regulator